MSSIERPPHRIRGEKSFAMPRHLLFFDTETRMKKKPNGDVEHSLKLGWCCYWRRGDKSREDQEVWFDFKTCSSFWEFVFSLTGSKVKLWCVARNLSFDFTILEGWKYLKEAGYTLKFFFSKGPSTIISVVKDGSSIVLLDSMNWFPESIEKTGERIGLPKLHVDFDTVKDPELSIYCRRDVQIELENFRLFIRFLVDNHICRLCYTRASTAMAAYLARHYKTDIWIHNNKEAIDLERAAYKGGRVEAFHVGELLTGPFTTVDINSLYPSVMRQYEYPCKYVAQIHYPTLPEFNDYLKRFAIVAQVVVKTQVPIYPIRTERTVFPIGDFLAVLCTPELLQATNQGHIVKVISAVLYERADLFSSYVNTLYKMRRDFKEANNPVFDTLCKYLLNSLYGKFGQKAEDWVKIGDCPNEPDHYEYLMYHDKPGKVSIRYIMGECFEQVGKGESFDSFPAIAAHVTAYGRMRLWELMCKAGHGNYYYCDTDSLIVNDKGLRRLKAELSDSELGKLKVVEVSNKLIIHGLKDYETGTKIVTKGIRKNAKQVSHGVYTQDKWPSIQGLLRAGSVGPYTVERQTKHLSRSYEKGTVLPNGSVVPLVLSLPDESVDIGNGKCNSNGKQSHDSKG